MALSNKGSQNLGLITGASSTALTIPVNTKAIVVMLSVDGQNIATKFGAPIIGGITGVVAETLIVGSTQSTEVAHILDIASRTNDNLTWVGGDAATTAAVGILYLGGTDIRHRVTDDWTASCGTCNNPTTLSSSIDPSGLPETKLIHVLSMGHYSVGWSGLNGATQIFSTNITTNRNGSGSYKEITTTTTLGWTRSSLGFWSGIAAASYYEFEVAIGLSPTSHGAELGFLTAGAADLDVGTAAVLIPDPVAGIELGFPIGINIVKTSPRQVALVGEGIDVTEMTEDGTEGQVLTKHTTRKPTWEDTGITVTGRWVPLMDGSGNVIVDSGTGAAIMAFIE